MPAELIFAPHVDVNVKALNGGRRPRLSGEVLEMRVFDVGEGEAILLRIGSQGLLIDGGSESHTNNNESGAKRVFSKFPSGVKLDAVIASHPHRDHTNFYPYLVGKTRLLAERAVYYDNDTEPAKHHRRTIELAADDQLPMTVRGVVTRASLKQPWKGHLFRAKKGADVKYWSVFLLLQYRDAWFLFTGDAKKSYEDELLPDVENLTSRIHVLKITHHGSKTGTSPKLVSTLKPSIAVSSSAEDPGHRLEDEVRKTLYAAKVFSTYEQWEEEGRPKPPREGEVLIRTDGKERKISGVRGILFEVQRMPA